MIRVGPIPLSSPQIAVMCYRNKQWPKSVTPLVRTRIRIQRTVSSSFLKVDTLHVPPVVVSLVHGSEPCGRVHSKKVVLFSGRPIYFSTGT